MWQSTHTHTHQSDSHLGENCLPPPRLVSQNSSVSRRGSAPLTVPDGSECEDPTSGSQLPPESRVTFADDITWASGLHITDYGLHLKRWTQVLIARLTELGIPCSGKTTSHKMSVSSLAPAPRMTAITRFSPPVP